MTSEKQRAAEVNFKPTTKKLTGQKLEIVVYIYTHGSITPMGAIHAFGCTKLSTRIGEIEKRCGHAFERTSDAVYSRTGRRTKVRRYAFAEGLTAQDYKGRAAL